MKIYTKPSKIQMWWHQIQINYLNIQIKWYLDKNLSQSTDNCDMWKSVNVQRSVSRWQLSVSFSAWWLRRLCPGCHSLRLQPLLNLTVKIYLEAFWSENPTPPKRGSDLLPDWFLKFRRSLWRFNLLRRRNWKGLQKIGAPSKDRKF